MCPYKIKHLCNMVHLRFWAGWFGSFQSSTSWWSNQWIDGWDRTGSNNTRIAIRISKSDIGNLVDLIFFIHPPVNVDHVTTMHLLLLYILQLKSRMNKQTVNNTHTVQTILLLYSIVELYSQVQNSQQIDLLPLQWPVQFDAIHFLIGAHH